MNSDYEAEIAALERQVGQLTMELDLVKKRHAFTISDSENVAIVTGPKPAPFDGVQGD